MIIIEVGVRNLCAMDQLSVLEWLTQKGILSHFNSLSKDDVILRFVEVRSFIPGDQCFVMESNLSFVRFAMSADTHGDAKKIGMEIRKLLKARYGALFEDGCRHLGCGV